MRSLHRFAATTAIACVALFWSTTVVVELFGDPEQIATVKRTIVYGLAVLIPAMAVTGITGVRLAAGRRTPVVVEKQKRMPWIAANGLLILVPAAFILDRLAAAGSFSAAFYSVQALELAAGAVNLWLLTRNFQLGRALVGR